MKRILFLLAAFFLFFFLLDKIPLWSSDEGRYGEIAREMLESRQFVVPHFNYLPYLDKPVLAPVLTAGAYMIFGVNAFATRLVSVISALLGIFFLQRFARRLFDARTGDFSAVVLLTTLGYVLVGRFAVIDMLMTLLLSLTLFCFMTAFFEQNRRYYLGAYFLMGLAFLSKGLIAIVLPAGIFFLFLVFTRSLHEIKKMHLLAGMGILALVILPWMFLISAREPEFFNEFIVKQHFSRFATGTFGRRRPFWFFAPILIATAFPWTFFLPAALVQAIKNKAPERQKSIFLICWIIVVFVFFSIPKSKLPYYILPVSMPIALLVGSLFSKIMDPQNGQGLVSRLVAGAVKIFAGLSVIAFCGVSLYLLFGVKETIVHMLAPFLLAGSAAIAIGGLASLYFYHRQKNKRVFFALAAMVYVNLLLTIGAMKVISPLQSVQEYAAFLRSQLRPGDIAVMYSSPDRFSDLPFYLRRRVVVVGSDRGTLQGQSEELSPEELQKYFWTKEAFVQKFIEPRGTRIFCVVAQDKMRELQDAGLKGYQEIMKNHEQILISNELLV